MIEKVVSHQLSATFVELKAILAASKCKLVGEKPPNFISVEQGSIWGVTPKSIKKKINFYLSANNSSTKISAYSELATSVIILAILTWPLALGSITFAKGLAIRLDIEANQWYTSPEARQSYRALANLVRICIYAFLALAILDTILTIIGYIRVDSFAKEILQSI